MVTTIYHPCSFFCALGTESNTHQLRALQGSSCIFNMSLTFYCTKWQFIAGCKWHRNKPKHVCMCLGYEPATPQANQWNMGLSLPLNHPAFFFIRCICTHMQENECTLQVVFGLWSYVHKNSLWEQLFLVPLSTTGYQSPQRQRLWSYISILFFCCFLE